MDYEGIVAQGLDARLRRRDRDRRRAPTWSSRSRALARFFAHESCAQCTQCREGTAWTTKILERIVAGRGQAGGLRQLLLDLSDNMTGKTICVLSDSCAAPVVSGIQKFRGEFEAYIEARASRQWRRSECHPTDARTEARYGRDLRCARMTAPSSIRGPMADELVNVTIDGMPVSVPKGTSILEAAKQAGVLVPHYCYHPSLPVAGVCRMCLVEVEKAPKLMPACATAVAEGQVVHVNSREAPRRRARACSRCCSSTTRSTARSAIRPASASCRTTCSRKAAPARRYARVPKRFNPVEDFGARRPVRPQPLHPLHPLRPLHGGRGGRRRCSTCRERGDRAYIGSPRTSRSTTPGPATWWTSARSARCCPRTS